MQFVLDLILLRFKTIEQARTVIIVLVVIIIGMGIYIYIHVEVLSEQYSALLDHVNKLQETLIQILSK